MEFWWNHQIVSQLNFKFKSSIDWCVVAVVALAEELSSNFQPEYECTIKVNQNLPRINYLKWNFDGIAKANWISNLNRQSIDVLSHSPKILVVVSIIILVN